MRYVKRLDEMTKEEFQETGGKAANLGEMIQGGFNVPGGFCVTGRALDYLLETREILPKIMGIVETLNFDEYGFHATVKVKTIKALYYKAGKDRLLKIVLVHDVDGKRPDQMFYCTRMDWDARQILHAYAARWSIGVAFRDCKPLLGFDDTANRPEKAVRRTAPMAMVLYSLIAVWFERGGHRHVEFPERPWYRTKEEPSFTALRDGERGRAFPIGLDPFQTTRFEMADFAVQAQALGINYVGICCGAGPHHVRAMAEALGRKVPASRYSPDMSLHPALGVQVKERDKPYLGDWID